MRFFRHRSAIKHRRTRFAGFAFVRCTAGFFPEAAGLFFDARTHQFLLRHLQVTHVNIFQETARITELHLPVFETALGIRQVAVVFSPCHCYIKQTAFFLECPIRSRRQRTREQIFFQPHHKHIRELQSLGGMNGHQCHFRLCFPLLFILVGQQGNL